MGEERGEMVRRVWLHKVLGRVERSGERENEGGREKKLWRRH